MTKKWPIKSQMQSMKSLRRKKMTTVSSKKKQSRLKTRTILKKRKRKMLTSLAKVSLTKTLMAILKTKRDAPKRPRDSRRDELTKRRKMCSIA